MHISVNECISLCLSCFTCNTISQNSNDGYFLNLVYGFDILRERYQLFSVEVKGHLTSREVISLKLVNTMLQDKNDRYF